MRNNKRNLSQQRIRHPIVYLTPSNLQVKLWRRITRVQPPAWPNPPTKKANIKTRCLRYSVVKISTTNQVYHRYIRWVRLIWIRWQTSKNTPKTFVRITLSSMIWSKRPRENKRKLKKNKRKKKRKKSLKTNCWCSNSLRRKNKKEMKLN